MTKTEAIRNGIDYLEAMEEVRGYDPDIEAAIEKAYRELQQEQLAELMQNQFNDTIGHYGFKY